MCKTSSIRICALANVRSERAQEIFIIDLRTLQLPLFDTSKKKNDNNNWGRGVKQWLVCVAYLSSMCLQLNSWSCTTKKM